MINYCDTITTLFPITLVSFCLQSFPASGSFLSGSFLYIADIICEPGASPTTVIGVKEQGARQQIMGKLQEFFELVVVFKSGCGVWTGSVLGTELTGTTDELNPLFLDP